MKSRPWPDIFELYVEKSINQCEMKVENSKWYIYQGGRSDKLNSINTLASLFLSLLQPNTAKI